MLQHAKGALTDYGSHACPSASLLTLANGSDLELLQWGVPEGAGGNQQPGGYRHHLSTGMLH